MSVFFLAAKFGDLCCYSLLGMNSYLIGFIPSYHNVIVNGIFNAG